MSHPNPYETPEDWRRPSADVRRLVATCDALEIERTSFRRRLSATYKEAAEQWRAECKKAETERDEWKLRAQNAEDVKWRRLYLETLQICDDAMMAAGVAAAGPAAGIRLIVEQRDALAVMVDLTADDTSQLHKLERAYEADTRRLREERDYYFDVVGEWKLRALNAEDVARLRVDAERERDEARELASMLDDRSGDVPNDWHEWKAALIEQRNEWMARAEKAEAALQFYADPDTYAAITFLADPPCGGFAEDIGPVDEYSRDMPGQRAREVLLEPAGERIDFNEIIENDPGPARYVLFDSETGEEVQGWPASPWIEIGGFMSSQAAHCCIAHAHTVDADITRWTCPEKLDSRGENCGDGCGTTWVRRGDFWVPALIEEPDDE